MDIMGTGTLIKLSDSEDPDSQTFGYWVDLKGVQFNEGTDASWIQAMPLGTWMHPVHGAIVISKERVKAFADNVKGNVRGQELDIDYEHKEKIDDAAGWVKDAKVNLTDADPNRRGLYLLVEWTAEAAEKIRNKAYRYFSPEYVSHWTNPATSVKHTDVLFGGALTNRPFLKGILPINLSEMTAIITPEQEGDNDVDRALLEAIAKSLGVKFDADTSDADLQTKVSGAADAANAADDSADEDADSDEANADEDDADEDAEDTVEADAELAKLSESSPAVKALVERMERQETAIKMANTRVRLSDLATNGDVALTPKMVKKLNEILVKAPSDLGDAVYAVVKSFMGGTATIELTEKGGQRTRKSKVDTSDPFEDFNTAVTKLTEGEKGLDYGDAVDQVALTEPELYARYRQSSYAGTTFADDDGEGMEI